MIHANVSVCMFIFEWTYIVQRSETSPWTWPRVRSIKMKTMKKIKLITFIGYMWPTANRRIWQTEKGLMLSFVTNLKVDGGLLAWSARTELFPKSCLCPSLGVNGRWVDWTRRNCLASLTISALVFLKALRRGMKGLQLSCFLSIETI